MVDSPNAEKSLLRENETNAWDALFAVGNPVAGGRNHLAERLESWCHRTGCSSAALYGQEEGAYRRLAAVGSEVFPDLVDRAEVAGASVLELPGALLVTDTDTSSGPDDPVALLLAAAAQIVGLREKINQQRFQARFRSVELEALYEVGMAIASTLDLDELAEEVLLRAVSLIDARHGALYLIEDGQYRLRSRIGGTAATVLDPTDRRVAAALAGSVPAGDAMIRGAEHLLAVAVEMDGDTSGLLLVGDKESRSGVGSFPASDERILSLFANQAAIALENAKLHRLALEKERLEREMELAAEIQQQLLPKETPAIQGYDVLGWNRPARQVGGDYFDVRALDERRWVLVVGDVTGKGLPAALLVSTLHSALRLLPDSLPIGSDLVVRLNRHIHEASASNKFITLLLAELDPVTGVLSYLNAGHNPGVLMRADGRVEELAAGGLPLGLLPLGEFESRTIQLEPGDLLCIYSDGITECATPDEEEYGMESLVKLLANTRDAPLAEIVKKLDDEVVAFAQGQPQGDDQTVILLRRDAPAV